MPARQGPPEADSRVRPVLVRLVPVRLTALLTTALLTTALSAPLPSACPPARLTACVYCDVCRPEIAVFVGHYGVSFAARRAWPEVPLWVWFIAVQLLDVIWAPFILLGIERVRIVPGITASNPLDLYYMPYTHSLVAALLWSAAAVLVWRAFRSRRGRTTASLGIGLAVFSHWVLDFIVHRPDLPLYDNTARVGLGLWNFPALAFSLEAGIMLAGLLWYLGGRFVRPVPLLLLAALMLVVHAVVFFGAPPATPAMAAVMALASYALFAFLAYWLEHRYRQPALPPSA